MNRCRTKGVKERRRAERFLKPDRRVADLPSRACPFIRKMDETRLTACNYRHGPRETKWRGLTGRSDVQGLDPHAAPGRLPRELLCRNRQSTLPFERAREGLTKRDPAANRRPTSSKSNCTLMPLIKMATAARRARVGSTNTIRRALLAAGVPLVTLSPGVYAVEEDELNRFLAKRREEPAAPPPPKPRPQPGTEQTPAGPSGSKPKSHKRRQ